MTLTKLRIRPATTVNPNRLADFRALVMRPSLEAVGRFDPDRARARLLEGFDATETWILRVDGKNMGFFSARRGPDHLRLAHLYLDPAVQRGGIGRQVVENLKTEARCVGLPIHVTALSQSPANPFYLSCGFKPVSQDDLDTHYAWSPVAQSEPALRAAE